MSNKGKQYQSLRRATDKERMTVNFRKSSSLLTLILLLASGLCCGLKGATFCLDYRYRPDSQNFLRYDLAIFDIGAQVALTQGHALGKEFYSYLSVGEVGSGADYLGEVQALNLTLPQKNDQWGSYYVDVANPGWADYVVRVLGKKVVDKGYDGFFLDTVDTAEL